MKWILNCILPCLLLLGIACYSDPVANQDDLGTQPNDAGLDTQDDQDGDKSSDQESSEDVADTGTPNNDTHQEDIVSTINVLVDKLEITFVADSLYYVTCTHFIRLYKDGGGTPTELINDPERIGSRLEGYYLDGIFIMPVMDEGCDVIMCQSLGGQTHTVSTIEYTQIGTKPLPEGYGDPNNPKEVADIISKPYAGKLSVQITYYKNQDCQDMQAGLVYTQEVEIK